MPEEGVTPDSEVAPPLPVLPLVTPKMWYLSAELWSAFFAIIAFVIQGVTGTQILPPEIQASVVVLWLAFLRGFKTASPVAWTKKHYNKLIGIA